MIRSAATVACFQHQFVGGWSNACEKVPFSLSRPKTRDRRSVTDFTPALKKLLRKNGFAFLRSGRGDHEIWQQTETGQKVVVDHAIRSRHTANGVLKQAGLPKAF